jgi:hypothetical protein
MTKFDQFPNHKFRKELQAAKACSFGSCFEFRSLHLNFIEASHRLFERGIEAREQVRRYESRFRRSARMECLLPYGEGDPANCVGVSCS